MALGTPLMGTDPKDWKWQQIAKVGRFSGHPSGPFELNSQVFDEIVSNFKNDDQPIQWDLQHASEAENASELEGAEAHGWIHDLQNRGARGLWALTEWAPEVKAKIENGKYRFCSPAIVFKSKDRVTGQPVGARLTSAALTGIPFLAGMQPLAAKHELVAVLMKSSGMSAEAADLEADKLLRIGLAFKSGKFHERSLTQPHEYMPSIRAGLCLSEIASHVECSDQVDRLRQCCEMADDSGMHEGVDLRTKYLSALADATGMSASASPSDILDAVEEMIDAAIARHEATYHEGGANLALRPIEAPLTETITEEEQTTMAAPTEADLLAAKARTTTLEGEVTVLSTKATTLSTQVTTLTARAEVAEGALKEVATLLKLSAGSETPAVTAAIKVVLEENATLLAAKTARDDMDIVADVDRVIQQYGPTGLKKVEEADKPSLLDMRRSTPKAFLAMYKPLTADELRLSMKVTPPAPPRKLTPIDPNDPVMLSHSALTSKLMSDEKLSYDAASDKAAKLIRARPTTLAAQ